MMMMICHDLQTSDAVLVDIRSDRDRRRQGLPVLEAGAYGKGAIIPRFALGSGSSMCAALILAHN